MTISKTQKVLFGVLSVILIILVIQIINVVSKFPESELPNATIFSKSPTPKSKLPLLLNRWVPKSYEKLTKSMSFDLVPLTRYPEITQFLAYFPFDPQSKTVPKIPQPDLDRFLGELRALKKNLFVAPTTNVSFLLENSALRQVVSVEVNVIWESFRNCNSGKDLCLHGERGEVGFLEFILDHQGKIMDWKFKQLEHPLTVDWVEESDEPSKFTHQFNSKPTFFLHCDYSGRYFSVSEGFFNYDWLTHWKLAEIQKESQNGEQSVSSIDTRGCYTSTLFLGAGWNGKSLILRNVSEPCFQLGLGWMNDRCKSFSVSKSC